MIKQILTYGLPLVPTSFSYWIFVSSDKFLLTKLSTFEQVGLYSLANNIVSILSFLINALGQSFSPYMLDKFQNNREDFFDFMGNSLVNILLIFSFLTLGISLFSHELLVILTTPKFYEASLAVIPLSLSSIAFATTQVTAAGITLANKTYYFTIFSFLSALFNIVLNLVFIPRFGMLAASYTTLLSYVFLTISYSQISRNFFKFNYDNRKIILICFLTTIFCFISPFLISSSELITFSKKLFLYFLYLLLLFCLKIISPIQFISIARHTVTFVKKKFNL